MQETEGNEKTYTSIYNTIHGTVQLIHKNGKRKKMRARTTIN